MTIPLYCFDDAFSAGFSAGQDVPSTPPSNEQAWSDFRAENDRGVITHGEDAEVAAEYVRGHLDGQVEPKAAN